MCTNAVSVCTLNYTELTEFSTNCTSSGRIAVIDPLLLMSTNAVCEGTKDIRYYYTYCMYIRTIHNTYRMYIRTYITHTVHTHHT